MNMSFIKKRKWKIMGMAFLVVIAYTLGRGSVACRVASHAQDTPEHHLNHAVAQEYTCSMHPQVRSTDPHDRCPLCGMELIPVPQDDEEPDDAELPRLRLSARSMALLEVQTRPAERRPIERTIRLYGRVDFDETTLLDVVIRTDGYIEKLYARYGWQAVEEGETLAEIYSPEVVTAFREMQAALDRNDGGTQAAQSKLQRLGVTQDQLVEVMRTGEIPGTFRLVSPKRGVVQDLAIREGDAVKDGSRLLRLVDTDDLWVVLEAYESEVSALNVGQHVEFTVQALPGDVFEGEIAFIDPSVGDLSRTARVRVPIAHAGGGLKPGMWGNALVRVPVVVDEGDPLLVPASAPLITGRRALVYVRDPDAERPTFEPRQVQLGPRAGEHYVVLEGLQEGEQVVVQGQFKIDSELQIRGRPSMMQPAGGRPPGHHHGPAEQDHGEHTETLERMNVDEPFTEDLGRVLLLNFDLVEALAGDDPDAARRVAEEGLAWLRERDRQEWIRLADPLEHLAQEEGLGPQRRRFESFSDALTDLVRQYGTGTVQPVYRAMCPMVEGRRAYWLQPDQTILNPYHGASMLRCGAIVGEVSANE